MERLAGHGSIDYVVYCDTWMQAKRKADSEVESHETYLAALKKQHKDAVEENKALKHELEHMANELLQQARQRGDEQRRWAEKLTKAQEDLAKVTEDTRLQTQRYVAV